MCYLYQWFSTVRVMKDKFGKYSDKELVKIICKKNSKSGYAFKEIYNRYAANVHAYCLRVLSNEDQAEDIFQETFIRFFQKVDINNSTTNVPGFLITIARNLCLNQKRNKKNTVPIEDVEYLKNDAFKYEDVQLMELITMALDLLETSYREPFVLREYNGMQYDEISEQLGITVPNAKTRVFRAKQKIKEILQPYLDELEADRKFR